MRGKLAGAVRRGADRRTTFGGTSLAAYPTLKASGGPQDPSLSHHCRAPEEVFNQEFEVDHVVPQAGGGSDDFANLALASHSCNLRKGTAQRARDPETGQIVPLFNPRTDDWGEHFAVDLDNFSMEGLTANGRASVRRLGINRKVQVDARRLWISRLVIRF